MKDVFKELRSSLDEVSDKALEGAAPVGSPAKAETLPAQSARRLRFIISGVLKLEK